MTRRQLRALRVVSLKQVAHAIKKLDVALLGVLLERRYKGPRHGARGLRVDVGVGAIPRSVQPKPQKNAEPQWKTPPEGWLGRTHEV